MRFCGAEKAPASEVIFRVGGRGRHVDRIRAAPRSRCARDILRLRSVLRRTNTSSWLPAYGDRDNRKGMMGLKSFTTHHSFAVILLEELGKLFSSAGKSKEAEKLLGR